MLTAPRRESVMIGDTCHCGHCLATRRYHNQDDEGNALHSHGNCERCDAQEATIAARDMTIAHLLAALDEIRDYWFGLPWNGLPNGGAPLDACERMAEMADVAIAAAQRTP